MDGLCVNGNVVKPGPTAFGSSPGIILAGPMTEVAIAKYLSKLRLASVSALAPHTKQQR